jgi:hypothetical protein
VELSETIKIQVTPFKILTNHYDKEKNIFTVDVGKGQRCEERSIPEGYFQDPAGLHNKEHRPIKRTISIANDHFILERFNRIHYIPI